MMLPRRKFLHLTACAGILPMLPYAARAEVFPSRPVHLIVGFAPGGVGDIIARLMGQAAQERLGQPVVIENRSGAGGNIGTEAVVRSAADGYTLIWAGTNNAVNATLYKDLKYNFIRDIAMVTTVMRGPLVLLVNPAVPARSTAEFIAFAKANPDKVNMASSGNGTSTHLTGELFKMMAGVSMVHVPYKSEGPALADLIAGQVQVMFANLPSSVGYIRAGQLRALGVTTKDPSTALPGIPPLAATVPGYESSAWYGVGAPKATPAEVIGRLNKEIIAGLADPKIAARLADLGGIAMPLSPSEADAFVAADTEKWARVVQYCGAKVD